MTLEGEGVPAKIVLVDPHPIGGPRLVRTLSARAGLEVCDLVPSILLLPHALETHEPDVVLMALNISDAAARGFLFDAAANAPTPRYVALLERALSVEVDVLLEGGVCGCVLRWEAPWEFTRILRRVHAGECVLSRGVSDVLMLEARGTLEQHGGRL